VPASSATPPPQQTPTSPAPQVASVALQEQSQPQPAPSAPQSVAGTVANAQLEADITRMIRTMEGADHPDCTLRVVKQWHSVDKPGMERWDVMSCDAAISFDVEMVPSPRGGTDFRVHKSKNVVSQDKTTGTPAPPEPGTSTAPPAGQGLPEGFVLYEGSKEEFTIAIPKDWTGYDQGQMLKATGMGDKMGGGFNMIYFLPAKDLESTVSGVGLLKVDTGEIPSFFVQKLPADKGMSCAGFSDKAEKKLVDLIAKDPPFKGKNALEPAHAEPAGVGGCKGVRVQAKGKSKSGSPLVVDTYMASDGQTVYIFSLRNLADNFEKNKDVFHQAVSTLKLSAAK